MSLQCQKSVKYMMHPSIFQIFSNWMDVENGDHCKKSLFWNCLLMSCRFGLVFPSTRLCPILCGWPPSRWVCGYSRARHWGYFQLFAGLKPPVSHAVACQLFQHDCFLYCRPRAEDLLAGGADKFKFAALWGVEQYPHKKVTVLRSCPENILISKSSFCEEHVINHAHDTKSLNQLFRLNV